uniref:Uncharacterized protein n=1 Tax=Neogobius melanostomus TaxID=47308 RepID=A0A8C6U2N6_9GOBI
MAASLWRRSVEEVSLRRRQQVECERAQEALSRVTSCFQQLASSLGSSADGSFLREELHETRALAYRISQGLARRLIRLLSNSDSAVGDRKVSERLWVNFLSAMECFLCDLRKACDLIVQFPLSQRSDRRALVNSGCVDGVVGLAARVASVQAPWISLDEDPAPNIQSHIRTLDHQLQNLQLRVPVAFWGVEPTKPLWFQMDLSRSEVDPEQSLEELMTVPVVNANDNNFVCCHFCV